jgi:divalent metal cation (Fe/Co/Zn/Cd) transporter
MSVPWADLATVLFAGLLLGAGVVIVYAVGVRVLSPAGADGEPTGRPTPIRIAITSLCFALCAAAVAYGIYTLL